MQDCNDIIVYIIDDELDYNDTSSSFEHALSECIEVYDKYECELDTYLIEELMELIEILILLCRLYWKSIVRPIYYITVTYLPVRIKSPTCYILYITL